MAKEWGPGDEVVVTRLDHDGNVRPWVIAAQAVGAWMYVDAVHLTAHASVSLERSGADFLGCSTYKFLGPHAGVVAARPELLERLRPDKLAPATDEVPERFELGTLPYELMAGATAAVEFLADLAPGGATTRRERLEASLAAVAGHEDRLRERVEDGLRGLPGVTLHSRAATRTPTVLVTFDGHDAESVSRHLATRGVNAPAGSFYAYEPAKRLGLGEAGGLRLGLAPYSDDSDVDRLLEALADHAWA
jgi:selenocysteine lyase/cysteine desulfurase